MLAMIKKLLFLFLVFSSANLFSQTAYEALRNAMFSPTGSARSVGIGGSIGAFGADFTTLYNNPAGTAAFRRSDFTITPQWTYLESNSQVLTDSASSPASLVGRRNNIFRLANAGFVSVSSSRAGDWRTVNFGLGIIRTADFDQGLFFQGSSEGSITGRFAELADGLTPDELDDFEAGLAYETGAIYNAMGDNTVYLTDFTPGEQVPKSQSVKGRGGITELEFALAGNYREKLMVGGTIGIPFLRYEENKYYREVDENNENKYFNELIYEENLTTVGAGVNFKFGLIYLPVHHLRLGFAVHTPTFFKLNDSYRANMIYDYTVQGQNYRNESSSPDGYFEYRLRTPWRFLASGGVLIDKQGFISAEAEWVNYGSSYYAFKTSDPGDLSYEQQLNREISEEYKTAVNLRLGGELRLGVLRLRAGYRHAFSPYRQFNTAGASLHAGLGLRLKKFYLDLAYVRAAYAEAYFPYETTLYPATEVDTEVLKENYLMTLGFKF